MTKRKRFLGVFLLIVLALLSLTVTACSENGCSGEKNPQEKQVQIKLNTTDLKLRLYSEYNLSVKKSEDFQVVFKSEDTEVATVSESGVIYAVGVGKTTISVSYETVSQSCNVIVYETTEVPTIELQGLSAENSVNLMPNDIFSVKPQIVYDGQSVDASVKFEIQDENVATITDSGIITAIGKGSTIAKCVATYKKWTVEKIFSIKVVSDVVVALSKYTVDIYSSDVVGQKTFDKVSVLGVYSDGQLLGEQPEITWTSANQQIATVNDGLIQASGIGQTQVIASCAVDGEEYSAIVNVTVRQPQLSSVNNIRVEDGKIKWDEVDYADGYVFTANLVHEDLTVNEYDITKLYGKVEFTLTPYSNDDEVKDGEKIKYNTTFKTADITEKMLVTSPSAEGGTVTKVEGISEDVYKMTLKANDFAMGRGGVFKVVYMTPFMESRVNSQGKQPFVDVKAIVDNDYDLTEFKEMTISFWAYGYDKDVTFTLARTSANPSYEKGATVHAQQTVPMREWTRVELRVDSNIYLLNNNLYAAILASSDFYFTDVHINTLDYENTIDHTYCEFYAGMNFASAVSALPENLPSISSVEFVEFESKMLYAQSEYELLTEGRLATIDQTTKNKFNSLKKGYVENLITTLPEKDSLTYYNGETVNLAYAMLESLSEEEKAQIQGVAKLSELKEIYDSKYIVAFNTNSPWMTTETNAYKRVDLGVNSYLASVTYSTDRSYYFDCGTVTKAEVAVGATNSTEDTTNHLHTLFDATALKALLEANADVLEVRFSILTNKGTNWDINKVGSKVTAERVYKNLSLSAGFWTEVCISRADALTTNGALRRASLVFDGAQTVYFTNFYLIKSSEIITPIIEDINRIPQTVEEVDMYDGSVIYSAYNAYSQLTEEYKVLVTNRHKLIEIKEYYDEKHGLVFQSQENAWIHNAKTGTYAATGAISFGWDSVYGKVIRCEVEKKSDSVTNSQNYRVHFNNLKNYLTEYEEVTEVKFKVFTTKTSSEYMVNGTYLRLEANTWTEITLTREQVMAKDSQTLNIGSFTSTAAQTLIFTNFYFVKVAN